MSYKNSKPKPGSESLEELISGMEEPPPISQIRLISAVGNMKAHLFLTDIDAYWVNVSRQDLQDIITHLDSTM